MEDENIRWISIQYRTAVITVTLLLGTVLAIVIVHLARRYRPSTTSSAGQHQSSSITPVALQHAQFANLEGDVQVKKVGAAGFSRATIDSLLDQGDTVQTASNGWARIMFCDGTSYLLNPSSLIVIEKSQVASTQTKVEVNLTSGIVDLRAGPGLDEQTSSSSVRFADATATLSSEAEARVDATSTSPQFTLVDGHATVGRGNSKIAVGPYQSVKLNASGGLALSNVPQSPHLLTPQNLSAILTHGHEQAVQFAWTTVNASREYRLRVSRSPSFTRVVADRKVTQPALTIEHLLPGTYYWSVTSVEASGADAPFAEQSKFTITTPLDRPSVFLRVEDVEPMGGVFVIRGQTDPGNSVFVNDHLAPLWGDDGGFQFVVQPCGSPVCNFNVIARDQEGRTVSQIVEAKMPSFQPTSSSLPH